MNSSIVIFVGLFSTSVALPCVMCISGTLQCVSLGHYTLSNLWSILSMIYIIFLGVVPKCVTVALHMCGQFSLDINSDEITMKIWIKRGGAPGRVLWVSFNKLTRYNENWKCNLVKLIFTKQGQRSSNKILYPCDHVFSWLYKKMEMN